MDAALFSPSSLFQETDGEDGADTVEEREEGIGDVGSHVAERRHSFPGMELMIREFSFHYLNANLLWPGTFTFSEWLVQNQFLLQGQRILELGSGTGALAIFLRISFGVNITTSDFDDEEIEENIAYNCRINELDVLPHVRHSWGDVFPTAEPDWDLIIASDILLYVKQYPKLIKTLCFLLSSRKPRDNRAAAGSSQCNQSVTISGKQIQLQQPFFLMSWRRRIGKDDELFFSGCEDAGLVTEHLGSRVYYIRPRRLNG
ncbi:protein-lysine methyltransferase METTL21B isoform X2 [Asparagus officinalis]|uniref:protein-lysine methyltransferase METTL21B isoform X2 n=1 Tax=Asparagus officinalis TaxID=4686 RepID=UPI00098E7FBB|nr:protein-lysine methyltransferase METTL21B isoform X2 [Asparagus officinalis]